jgi:hypothetical protein
LFPLFATGVFDTGGKFAPGVVDTDGNLPPESLIPAPVSLTPVANLPRCQQHKGNWWQNLPPVSLIPVANSPPVSLTPVVHPLDLRISPRIFEKIRNDPNAIFRGLGEGDS